MDDENKSPSNAQEKIDDTKLASCSSNDAKRQIETNSTSYSGSESEVNRCREHVNSEEGKLTNEVRKASDNLEAMDTMKSALDSKG